MRHESQAMNDRLLHDRGHTFEAATAAARGLGDVYPLLAERRYTAGWHKARPSLWREPATPFKPMHWRYSESKRLIDLAGDWISTDLAERRNLLMFNPVGDNDYATLPTLVAAYQMIKPGEQARAHRHSPNALRLVLDGAGGVATVVDGVELPMQANDIVLTPGWTWHSHFNDGERNAYWIDFLDVPLVHRLETMFFEPHPNEFQTTDARPATSPLRIANADQFALLPAGAVEHRRVVLDTPSLRTIGLALHALGPKALSPTMQVAANRVYAVSEGVLIAQVGEQRFACHRGDVFAVPVWTKHRFETTTGARLLEVSDEPAQRLLGFYRQASHQPVAAALLKNESHR